MHFTCRYVTLSYTSLIVKERISIPILQCMFSFRNKDRLRNICQKFHLPTSGAATSLTREANWSLSLYTSSTVKVPRIALRLFEYKGTFQKRFSGFCPLRGGYPPCPLSFFGHNDCPLRGGGCTPPVR